MGLTKRSSRSPLFADAQRRRVAAYITSWVIAAALAALLFVVEAPGYEGSPLESGAFAAFIFLAASTAAEAVVLRLSHGRSDEVITLIEAAIALNILLFPATTALAITVAGMGLGHLIHRRHPIKLLFNLAQYALALMVALTVFHVVRAGGSPLGPRALIGLVGGMVAFGCVNAGAVAGIVGLMEGRSFRSVFTDGLHLTTLTVFGNTAIGVLGAVVWQTRPELTPLIIAPAVTLHFAYKGVVRSKTLLETVGTERDRLSRIVDGTSDGIVLLDSKGTIEVWSPAMEALTGVPREDAEGRSAADLLVGRDLSGRELDPLDALTKATADDPHLAVEMQFQRDGKDKLVLARHTVLFDQHGRVIGDAVMIHDVTREREVERMKDDFLARVSHEMRTPLTPIKGYAQILLRKQDAPRPFVEDAMHHIIGRVDHMSLLIDDLLLVSRIWAGSASLEDQIRWERFDVVPVIERVLQQFRVVETRREITFARSQARFEMFADPMRVEQVLTNLVSNACKYSAAEAPVHIVLDGDDKEVRLSVRDEGEGIPNDQLGAVFERFHRLEDPLTMRTGGMGLGLYISKEFAGAMGGSLKATSRVGEGSTFTLSMPRAEPDDGSDAEPTKEVPLEGPSVSVRL